MFSLFCLFSAQMVVEEMFLKDHNMHPAQVTTTSRSVLIRRLFSCFALFCCVVFVQVVGLEGLWGCLMMSGVILPSLYFLPGTDHGSYESAIDAFHMIGWFCLVFRFALFVFVRWSECVCVAANSKTLISFVLLYWVWLRTMLTVTACIAGFGYLLQRRFSHVRSSDKSIILTLLC